jgi:tetratricopeptide (TPR) repeat protein
MVEMSKRRLLLPLLAAVLFSANAFAQTGGGAGGSRELALGREAYGRRDFQEAVAHLSRAVQGLGGEREALAEAYLRLGMAYLVGLGSPAQALPAFLSSAELAADPATACLWAAAAARKLGQPEVAERLEARALAGPVSSGEERAEAPPRAEAPAPVPRPEAPAPIAETAPAPEKGAPAEEAKPAGKGDAFQYFFGKGRKKGETGKGGEKAPAGNPAEPPPAG